MPEFKTPGVYVEEIAARARPIEAAPTGVAGFVGLAEGNADKTWLLTTTTTMSRPGSGTAPVLDAAAQAFFDNGGRRLSVSVAPTPDAAGVAAALAALGPVDVVAAPGLSRTGVAAALIAYAEANRGMALIDPPAGLDVPGVTAFRAGFDSAHAAIYWPWIVTPTGVQPASPAIAGIFNRVDTERGVWKAPANEILRGATGFERMASDAEQAVLNPLGINVLRSFPGRGNRVWGARTLSSDPQSKYINVRRLLDWILRSLDEGLAWTVFEPNAEPLWAGVREAVEAFLYPHWQSGALMGTKPEQGFYVRCDRTTMSQDDLDNGRLVAQIGVAPLRPAEFIVVRLECLTADCPA